MVQFDTGSIPQWNAENNIDPNQVVPLYHQIYLILREQILEGRFETVPLPGELVLADQFKVSRVTMRRALQDLVKEGLIARGRGKGTFVKPRKEAGDVNFSAIGQAVSPHEGGILVDVLDVARVVAYSDIADILCLPPKEQAHKIVRLISTKGQPLGHLTTYIPESVSRTFGRRELQVRSIADLLADSGVDLGSVAQTMSAKLADSSVATALESPVGAPLVALNRVLYATNGRPVCVTRALYRPDRYECRLEMAQQDLARGRLCQITEYPNISSV